MPSPHEQPATSGISMHSLFIALYLMLIAFFIMLNSLSIRDAQKTQKALASIGKAFINKTSFSELLPEQIRILSFPEIAAQYFNDIESFLRSNLPLQAIEVSREGTSMQFALPMDTVFKDGQSDITGSRRIFIRDLSRLFLRSIPEASLTLSVRLDSANIPSPTIPATEAQYTLEQDRLTTLLTHILAQGTPKGGTSADIAFTGTAKLIITLRLEEVQRP